jgi:vacuolar-type H+-ATPase subunit B/Vma2
LGHPDAGEFFGQSLGRIFDGAESRADGGPMLTDNHLRSQVLGESVQGIIPREMIRTGYSYDRCLQYPRQEPKTAHFLGIRRTYNQLSCAHCDAAEVDLIVLGRHGAQVR